MKEDKSFLEIILSSIADGVFSVDENWRITSFNRAAERITGISAETAMGMKCSEVFHANICEHDCALRQSMESGCQHIDVPARILDKSGRSIPISLSTSVLRDENGNIMGAVETFRDLSVLEQLRREVSSRYTFEDIVGRSEAFQKIFAILPDVAESDATVLIEGPSGSGKELIARAVHNLSNRRNKPYIVVNCGTLPATLFESELFGYTRGAFTDATRNKPGRLEMAEGGTIFFDEISELPFSTQVKLLRVIQEREYEPLGALGPKKADIRVVAATNKNLVDLVSRGEFRDDLYFRLAVARLSIPPLRKRKDDIPFLVDHFITRFNRRRNKRIAGVSPAVMEILMRHDFPGNARELENVIEYAFVLCHDSIIGVQHLPEDLVMKRCGAMDDPSKSGPPPELCLDRAEAETIRAALERNDWHIATTAQELGISRTTLWRKMRKHSINRTNEEASI